MKVSAPAKIWAIVLFIIIIAGSAFWLIYQRLYTKEIRNVLLISIDTCRADHLSCYGYPGKTTPNIDAVAEQGLLYKNVITPVPLTCPAHSSILTGTVPLSHGVHDNINYELSDSATTLAEILKEKDYATGAIVSAVVLDSRFGLNQGFDTYNDQFDTEKGKLSLPERPGAETSRYANEWLEKNRDKSFFLFLHYYDPHYTWDPPEPFKSNYKDNPYAGEIAYVDYCIGQVIDKIKKLGLYDSTLIIITSDHGESLNEHGELTHGYFIYQSTLQVPLILKIPGIKSSKTISEMVSLIDIFPAICSLLKIQPPPAIQGEDISAYLTKQKNAQNERLFYCESFLPTHYDCNHLLGIVYKGLKYIHTNRPELYDLKNDPQESKNLITDQAQRAKVMYDWLREYMETNIQQKDADKKSAFDSGTLAKLESLGYVAGAKIEDPFEFDTNKNDPKDFIELHLLNEMSKFKLDQGYEHEAAELCGRIINLKPDFASPHYTLGILAFKNGNYRKAVERFKKYTELDPKSYAGYNNLGLSYVKLYKLDKAVECFQKSIEVEPRLSAETYYNLALVFVKKGQFDQAVSNLEKAIQINPDQIRFKNELENMLTSQKKFEQIAKYLQDNPNSTQEHYKMASFFYQQKNFTQAAEHCRKILEIDPDHIQARTSLAAVMFELGYRQEALQEYYYLLSKDPDSVNTLNSIAWILAATQGMDTDKSAQAVKFAEKACELTDYKQPQLIDTLAAALAFEGNFPQAVEAAKKAMGLAAMQGQIQLAEEIEEHLKLYEKNQRYYESYDHPEEPSFD